MSKNIFLFDLDSIITKQEKLPTISQKICKLKEFRNLTEITMRGKIPLNEKIAIGFGCVKNIAPYLLKSIDYAFYTDKRYAEFLKSLL
ncbi:MAG: hypothetical protein IJ068_05340 [Bacilli bacterium]|nr:hypothetical protein [Bacilli bacterium]